MGAGAEASEYDYLEPAQADDELGRLGPYRVLAALGRGGMGQVFRAEDTRLQRPVALKIMHRRHALASHSRNQFIHEARSMAAVRHDNVVTVYEVGEQSGTPYMAMELLKGRTLESATGDSGRLSYEQIFEYAKQIAKGLAAAHARGIVHRDIKPANLWIEELSGRVKILDFGLAVASSPAESLAGRGAVIGTPRYLSPEQAQSEPLDDRSDLYSLGVVLYELCCARLPYVARSVPELLIKIIAHSPPSPRTIAKDLPQSFADVIMRLLEKEPRDRVASATALQALIESACADVHSHSQAAVQIVTAPSSPTAAAAARGAAQPARRAPKPQSWWIATAVSAGLLLVGGTWWITRQSPTANAPMPVRVQSDEPIVLAASLEPFRLAEVIAGSTSVPSGQQARFQLRIINTAADGLSDPKVINARAKVIAQLRTYLRRPEEFKRQAPAFPKKLSSSQLPSIGEASVVEILFGTAGLPLGSYEVFFELQSPKGGKVSEARTQFTVIENLATIDLLGFDLITTGQGRGADTYVSNGSAADAGGRPFISVHHRQVNDQPVIDHGYLRFDPKSRAGAYNEIDRVVLLLAIEAGGIRGKSIVNAYGIPSGSARDWIEKGDRHLTWDSSPSANGVESFPFLGQVEIDNGNGALEKQSERVRLFGTALDDYVRQSGETVTIVLVRISAHQQATHFASHEGNVDRAPTLAIRAQESSTN